METQAGASAIVKLAPEDLDRAGETLCTAFDADPIYTHIFPAASNRALYLPPFWRAIIGLAVVYGETYATPDLSGVAAWVPPNQGGQTFLAANTELFALQAAVARFPEPAQSQFLAISNHADGLHPHLMAGRPHWYLWVIGVRPERQGQGLGSRLIRPMLARADAAGLPCYLETESERNVIFYRRLGFEVIRETVVPDVGLRLWMMARAPGMPLPPGG